MSRPWPDTYQPGYLRAVHRVMERGLLTEGPEVPALEREFAEWLGVPEDHVLALSSGTAAIHALLRLAGVGPGDEVIVPALTFTATALPAVHLGATPVFVDVDRTLNLDPALVHAACTKATKAIIGVDLHGVPADWDALTRIAAERRVALIEDACAGIGATWYGRKCGTFGHGAAVSLNQGKLLPGGEGGLLVSPRAAEARTLAYFGETHYKGGLRRVSATAGYNWKLPELSAAIARESLRGLDAAVERARRNGAILREAVTVPAGVPPVPPAADPAWLKLRVWIPPGDERSGVEETLMGRGVPLTRQETVPLPHHPAFRDHRLPFRPARAEKVLSGTVIIGNAEHSLAAAEEREVQEWADALKINTEEAVHA